MATSQNPSLHQTLLNMILDLDLLCRTNGLSYQIAAGTLLGAIREQNLIAWDRDADICMLRRDFDRFISIASKELSSSYFLQHHGCEPAMYSLVAKLRMRGTRRISDGVRGRSSMHEGIAVDIFPFDAVQPDTFAGQFHMWLCAQMKPVLTLRTVGDDHRIWDINKPRWLQTFAWICYQPLRLVPKPHLMAAYHWLVTYYSRKTEPTGYVSCLVSMPYPPALRLPRIRPLHSFIRLTTATIAGYTFPAPHNYHDVLTNLYGDYLTPPPPAKRQLGMRVEFDVPER